MSQFSFELQRHTNTVTSREQAHVTFWRGAVGQLGQVELIVPALEVVGVREPRETMGAMVTGENIPMSSFKSIRYGGRPRLAEGKLNVAGQHASFARKTLRMSRGGRALKIWAVGREYRYREEGNRRHHVLERPESRIVMTRSSASDPQSISGTAHAAVDSVDISLAILFEGVYTRNLSFRGALISAPGRFLDGLSSL
ncbi:hypothetical protein BN159_3857 [Streptomyces davaonensis JCM 4913]|uniref:Uncharacterized protein n=1 Tax=Streptomyces davaonensis (strain DSM 101723 / JCM 4913 / KCC S-0913 / 768) TaxID=1214101 RepID=K4QVX8_STRDJ|nr:hypothetical protein [Streptomyces davaonensis]CCK28236.1 hypothetical protein BN159_3857 [Streptomyces davaonensis JCM 4913]